MARERERVGGVRLLAQDRIAVFAGRAPQGKGVGDAAVDNGDDVEQHAGVRDLVVRATLEDLVDVHYATARGTPLKTSRSHAWLFHTARRHDRRVSVIGPLPLTTCQNSSQLTQSEAPHSQPSTVFRSAGSGAEMPTSHSFGT